MRPYGRPLPCGVGRVHRVRVNLGAERTARLRAVAARAAEGAPADDAHAALASFCAAVVGATLRRVGGGGAVVVGVRAPGRAPAADRAPVPVRLPACDRSSFADLARAAAGALAGAPNASGAAPADAVVAVHAPASDAPDDGPEWAAEPIAITLCGGTGGFTLALDLRDDVFDATTGALALRHLLAMFDAALADPAACPADVDLLTAEERRRILVEANATATPLPEAATVVDLVERQSRATPDAPAVVLPPGDSMSGRTLSYAALQAGVERVARGLARLGVGRGDRVGLLLGRSPELVMAMLGVMRAGATYVPLDPAYPAARLDHMAGDAGLALCLTEPALLDRAPAGVRPVVCDEAFGAEPGRVAPPRPARGDLAYVLYTSGSTGTPKGVEVTHEAVLNFVAHLARAADLGPADRFLQFASPSFDTAVGEIFPALTCGAAVVLRDSRWVESVPAFVARCAEAGVTAFSLPTAFWHELADALGRGLVALPACVRVAMAGGERMRPDRLASWRRAVGTRVPLWNGYGPTEVTVVSHLCNLTPTDTDEPPEGDEGFGEVSIGTPIANARAYVLDARRRPVPVGVPGELYVGGLGLARGYRGQPALTAARFVEDPFAPGERLYRTGDLARVRPDGACEVIGRIDAQVKVRGHRVEPGEVARALLALPGVRDGAVVAHGDAAAGARLVAYVVPCGSVPRSAPALREAVLDGLRRQLAEYMVPSAVVVLDALPLTPTGKVDRRALPAPGRDDVAASDAGRPDAGGHVPPRSPEERAVAAVWEEILGVPRVGARDNFFQLGGDSLRAVRMLGRVAEATGHAPSIAALQGDVTVERVAALLRAAPAATPSCAVAPAGASGERAEAITPIHTAGAQPPLFWLHGDFLGGGQYCRRLSDLLGVDQPFYAVHPLGLFGGVAPDTVEAMAERHVAAIRAVRPRGPYRLGGFCNGAVLAFAAARLLRSRGEAVDAVVLLDPPAHASRAPALLRLRLGVVRRLRRVARSWRVVPASPDLREASDLASHQTALDHFYNAVLSTHLPRLYRGRVVALVADATAPEDQAAVTAAWRRAAPALEADVTPGTHFDCMTTHAAALAERLRAAFGHEAPAACQPGPPERRRPAA